MQRRILFSLFLLLLCTDSMYSQVGINTTGATPDSTAMLDISSNGKGLLIPRLTSAERQGILNPAEALMVYDTDEKSFWYFGNGQWQTIATDQQTLDILGDSLSISNGNTIDLSSLRTIGTDGLNVISLGPEELDVSQTANNGFNYVGPNGNTWQSFKPTQSGYLTKVSIFFLSSSVVSEGQLTILKGEGSQGEILGTYTTPALYGGFNPFDLSENPAFLEQDSIYTFSFSPVSGYLYVATRAGNVYPDGRAKHGANLDLAFQTFMSQLDTSSLISINQSSNGE
ncbi:MAG: hypothetical protein AAFV80_17400, partial [Bacteroidota bacterium]